MSMEELTPEQTEIFNSFKEITQFDDKDEEKILKLLLNCQWNLEGAIPRFFDNNFDFPEARPAIAVPSRQPPINDDLRLSFDQMNRFEYRRSLPKANKLPSNWPFKHGIKINNNEKLTIMNNGASTNSNYLIFVFLLLPRALTFILLKLTDLLTLIYYKIFQKDAGRFPTDGPMFIYDPNNKEENEDSTNKKFYFKKYFEENVLKDTSDESLPILNDEYVDFNQAYDMAKSELKFLIIILIDTINNKESCDFMLKKFLGSQNIQKMVKDDVNGKDFLIWGTDINYLEGYLLGCKYNCKRTPYIALIGNVSTYGETFPTMSLIKYKNLNLTDDDSKLDIDSDLKVFSKSIDRYAPQIINQRIDKDEKDFERLMKQEQDNAYLESLQKDKIKKLDKEMKLKEIESKKMAVLNEKLGKYRFIKYLVQEMTSDFSDILLSKDKVATYKNNVVEDCTQCVTLQFKILQSGDKFVKKMSKQHTLNDIYLYVLLRLIINELIKLGKFESKQELIDHFKSLNLSENSEIVNNYNKFKFELNSPFPRFKVKQSNELTISDIKQLAPSCSLLVEYDLDFNDEFTFILNNIDDPQLEGICLGNILTVDSVKDEEINMD